MDKTNSFLLDIFIIWVIFQLVMLGMSAVNINNKLVNNTFDCEQRQISEFWGAVFPLTFFMSENKDIDIYCNSTSNQSE